MELDEGDELIDEFEITDLELASHVANMDKKIRELNDEINMRHEVLSLLQAEREFLHKKMWHAVFEKYPEKHFVKFKGRANASRFDATTSMVAMVKTPIPGR